MAYLNKKVKFESIYHSRSCDLVSSDYDNYDLRISQRDMVIILNKSEIPTFIEALNMFVLESDND